MTIYRDDLAEHASYQDGERMPRSGRPAAACTHHFLVEAPNGPTVEGVCRYCGTARTFLTSGISDSDETKRRHRSYDAGKAAVELQVLGDPPRRGRKRLSAEVPG